MHRERDASSLSYITLHLLLTAYSPMQQNAAQPARRWVIDDNHHLNPYLLYLLYLPKRWHDHSTSMAYFLLIDKGRS